MMLTARAGSQSKRIPRFRRQTAAQFKPSRHPKWYDTSDNAIGYAMHYRRSHDAVIRVYDLAGNVIETHQHTGDFKEW
jgi:hypothetical protein